jgi:hypothetical protein
MNSADNIPESVHIEGWTVIDACWHSAGGMVPNSVTIHVIDGAVIPSPAAHPAVSSIASNLRVSGWWGRHCPSA